MPLLLCAATTFEIEPATRWIREQHKNIDLLITGVGLPEVTYRLTKALSVQRPSMIIQAGIAGSLDEQLSPGETVVVESEYIGDLGVVEENSFKDLFVLGLNGSNSSPYIDGQLTNPDLTTFGSTYRKVKGVSVNEITTLPERMAHYKKQGAQIESLEGAALHYVALMEHVPFLQLRTISNYVGERDKSKWMLKEAITVLNNELIRILEKLS